MSNSELLACPWCREEWIKVRSENSACFSGECQECGARGPEAETSDAAIAAWNARSSTQLDELRAENARLKEVLTPSADTKASYIGEFKFSVEMRHPRLGSEFRSVDVPWTTIKEIMAAIRSKALGGTNV